MAHTSSHGGDTGSNIIIQVYGNTAEMGTDFAGGGDVGLTNAHVPISKLAWGDSTLSKRVTETQPLPVKMHGQTAAMDVSGTVAVYSPAGLETDAGATYGIHALNLNWNGRVRNAGSPRHTGPTSLRDEPEFGQMVYFAVAGSTSGPHGDSGRVGTSGPVWGAAGATAIAITGDVRLSGTTSIRIIGATAGYASATGDTSMEWDQGTSGGFGIPVNITGGRRLHLNTDSILVTGSVDISGGRALAVGTDSIKAYGYDGNKAIHTILRANHDGATLGFSGDALKVALTNVGITCSVDVSATLGVTNDVATADPEAAHGGLKIQGVSGGAPVVIRGDNSGAVEITATSALNTTVSGTVTINDTNITNSLELSSKPLIQTLDSIKTNTSQVSSIRNDLTSGNIRVKVTETVRPNTVISGVQTSTSSAAPLGGNKSVYSGVNIKSSPKNTTDVMIGGSDLIRNSLAGYPLEPGESIFVECDNLSKIYIRGKSEKLHYIGS